MKTNFNRLALAVGGLGALAVASNPAHAVITGAAGEAQLVPFVVSSGTGAANSGANYGNLMDTIVRITVPKAVGADVIPNCYTAPNTTPANGVANANCGLVQPGSENPAYAPTSAQGGYYIHWYFLDQSSSHKLNGKFSVSADDTYLFDWASESNGQWNNLPGYLIFVTEAGNLGQKASFNFMADAYLVTNGDWVNYEPALPMSDGADGTTNSPTINNNVVEISTTGQYIYEASPLVSGDRTTWANGNLNNYVFDLPLAINNQAQVTGGDANGYGTILVVWNDQNAAAWNSVPAYRFNNAEVSCSGSVALPYELNLVYVPNTNATAAAVQGSVPGNWANIQLNVDPYTASGASAAAVAYNQVCLTPVDVGSYPNTKSGISSYITASQNGGFLKIVPQEPSNSNAQTVVSSAVMFSIPIANTTGYPWADTILGHSRGAFTTAPN